MASTPCGRRADQQPALTTTWSRALGWRLARHQLTAPAGDALTVAGRLGGIQAQVMSSAELAIGIRAVDTPPSVVQRLLWSERVFFKTWAMRGTLHLLPAAEFPLWRAALSTRKTPVTPSWERYHGVTEAELKAITAAIPQALADRTGAALTREELAQAVADTTGKPHLAEVMRSGWGALLKVAANQGLLCFGPNRGRNVTFVAPADWLGTPAAAPGPAPDEALRTIVWRFLDAYGPATHEDFGRWWGVGAAVARRLFARHTADLVLAEVSGQRGWLTPEGAAGLAGDGDGGAVGDAEGVRLLPGFDPYVLAPISHREALIPEGFIDRVSRAAGWISPVLLVDGRIAGTWSPAPQGDRTVFTVEPFGQVAPAVRRAAETAAAAYEPLLGRPVELAWGPAPPA